MSDIVSFISPKERRFIEESASITRDTIFGCIRSRNKEAINVRIITAIMMNAILHVYEDLEIFGNDPKVLIEELKEIKEIVVEAIDAFEKALKEIENNADRN